MNKYRTSYPDQHGMTGSVEHALWIRMRQRCSNPKSTQYKYYGGRGITVCDRWQVFSNFFADMGPRPSLEYSIDRIDVNGNYEPGNVRWATKQTQAQNTTAAALITYQGETLNLCEWERKTGISSSTISRRLKRGWSVEEAMTITPKLGIKIRPGPKRDISDMPRDRRGRLISPKAGAL